MCFKVAPPTTNTTAHKCNQLTIAEKCFAESEKGEPGIIIINGAKKISIN